MRLWSTCTLFSGRYLSDDTFFSRATGPIGTVVLNGELDIDRAHGDLPSGNRTAAPQQEFVKVVKAVRVGGIGERLFRGRPGSFLKPLRPNRVGGKKRRKKNDAHWPRFRVVYGRERWFLESK